VVESRISMRRNIRFSEHALTRIEQRGATQEEVVAAIEHWPVCREPRRAGSFPEEFPLPCLVEGKVLRDQTGQADWGGTRE
jgi:hypothetical protein